MPSGDQALREAAFAQVEASLSAVACAARLLGKSAAGARERQLLAALHNELRRAEQALRRLR